MPLGTVNKPETNPSLINGGKGGRMSWRSTDSAAVSRSGRSKGSEMSENLRDRYENRRQKQKELTERLQMVEERIKQRQELLKTKLREKREMELEEEDEEIEENELLWNLNAVAIVSWRGNVLLPEEQHEGRNFAYHAKRTLSYLPLYLFRLLPLVIVFLEVIILISILDEGEQLKQTTDHDGIYQAKDIRWKRPDLVSKFYYDDFTPTNASCKVGTGCSTATVQRMYFPDSMMKARPADEIAACNNQTDHARYLDPAVANPAYLFSHCLPWEYAGLCVTLLRADGAFNSTLVGAGPSARYYCYLPSVEPASGAVQNRLSLHDWARLVVSPAAAAEAAEYMLVPAGLEEELDLPMWYVAYVTNALKTPTSSDADLSLFLYSAFQFMYYLGVGEAYLMEYIAVIGLSCYVYWSAFVGEVPGARPGSKSRSRAAAQRGRTMEHVTNASRRIRPGYPPTPESRQHRPRFARRARRTGRASRANRSRQRRAAQRRLGIAPRRRAPP